MDNHKEPRNAHKIVTFRYHLITTLLLTGLGSFLTTVVWSGYYLLIGVLGLGNMSYVITVLIPGIILYIGGAVIMAHVTTRRLPETFSQRYLPAVIPLAVTVISWAICYSAAGGSLVNMTSGWGLPFLIMNITHVIPIAAASLMNALWVAFLLPLLFNLTFLMSFAVFERRPLSMPKPINKKFILISLSVLIIGAAAIGVTSIYRKSTENILPPSYGYDYGGGYSSVDIEEYAIWNPDNILPELGEPPEFTILNDSDIPVLDGAEAAYPVYSAFADTCYGVMKSRSVKAETVEKYVTFTNTIYAYERLLEGEIDIFFGTGLSEEQLETAEREGISLIMMPIAYEAFVFFTDIKNPAESLTSEEIRAIYSGDITDWSELGGEREKIVAFQRPENSGSQTMLQYIMGDENIMKPLIEEVIGPMGEITERVADYKNAAGSLGFTFKFFLTGMTSDADYVKILAVDGVHPDDETIKNKEYPYIATLYAITAEGNDNPNVMPFVEWMQGVQGQYIVEQTGYIPIS